MHCGMLNAALAGPGVLFGGAVLACLVKASFPYGWTWVECLLFGAIFSATDPVAVIALLKEVRLPDHLAIGAMTAMGMAQPQDDQRAQLRA